jgi:hypothetical protein
MEFFIKSNLTVVPHPPYCSLFPQLKIKLKATILTQLRYWSLTEHRKHWEQSIQAEGDCFEVTEPHRTQEVL